MNSTIILIRHGQTEGNRKKIYCGFTDIGLNRCGKTQARKLQRRLKNQVIDAIYASDRKRALETAKIVFNDREVRRIPSLREMHFGIFEEMKHEEIMGRHPLVYTRWLNNPFGTKIPKGEGFGQFKKRVVCALSKIMRKHKNQTVAVVSHGGAISVFLNHLLNTKDFWEHIPKSASISIVESKEGRSKVRLISDIRHLS